MDATRAELRAVLLDARSLLTRPGNHFDWCSWEDAGAALREIDRVVAELDHGRVPSRHTISVWFAPTGPIQEVSLGSGWAEEFLSLATRCDVALAAFYGLRAQDSDRPVQ
ncbi:MAG: hypothetical protein K2X87_08230 [Gemmataceae bacterium]|nr:hypothetical protein [Gemmataceae bacterium]